MDVSRKRTFLKHLEPARPLRRSIHLETAPLLDAAACPQAKTTVGIEELYNIFNLDQQKKGKICYSREFLISLAGCPQSQTKPDFLADDSLLSSILRDAGEFGIHEVVMENGGVEGRILISTHRFGRLIAAVNKLYMQSMWRK